MTTLYASADAIRARAQRLDPVKVLIALVCAPLFVVGYVARYGWWLLALLLAACAEGWSASGRRIEARSAVTRGG